MSEKITRVLASRILSTSKDEIRKRIIGLLDHAERSRESTTDEFLDASLSSILAMRDTVLNDAAPEEERLRDGIVLGAFLEWLAEAGSFADTALHILPDVLQDFSPDSCEALAEKLREMEKLLRKSPLTILDENGKSAFLGMESHGTIPDTPPSGSSDEMELISQESYDLPEAVVRVSVADAETRFGELIGRVANERIIVELQDGGRIVARLTPADAASRVDPIDYGWSVGDYDVFKLVEEFGGAADADY